MVSARSLLTTTTFVFLSRPSKADPNDWVNLEYIFDTSARNNPATSDARQSISNSAQQTAQQGPWTVTNSQGMLPPNGNPHDYLSWAPYHWPNCDWCDSRKSRTINGASLGGADAIGEISFSRLGSPYNDRLVNDSSASSPPKRLAHVHRSGLNVDNIMGRAAPTTCASADRTRNSDASNSTGTSYSYKKDKRKLAAKCTPSPTTHMPPSATWTTCPYAVRDGKVNPDVLSLTGSKAMVHMSQSVLYNAVSYVLQGDQSACSQQASAFIDTFFLAPATAINPNVNFGQLVRGPGAKGQMGTFTGVLDLRGTVKVVNAIAMLMYSRSPYWTSQKHTSMRRWMSQYLGWLETSSLGKEVAGKPNNHATFYINQLAVTKIYTGDLNGATIALQKYFNTTFLDQIAISGEQPFEAVRTRPFHYRCFNLEAMITNAKLGDELGQNFWKAKSKHGATIQTAVDYAMGQDPKGEDVTELAPHVAAVAAAYGDPTGIYAAFLRRVMPDYESQPFWFYDQAQALPNSPGARLKSYTVAQHDQSVLWDIFGLPELGQPDVTPTPPEPATNTTDTGSSPPPPDTSGPLPGGTDSSSPSTGNPSGEPSDRSPVGSECPEVFALEPQVEIDDGIFVTCEELKPFYELPASQTNSAM